MMAALLPEVRQVVAVARSFCRRVIKRCLFTNYTVTPGLL
jgi:hypothetical protein